MSLLYNSLVNHYCHQTLCRVCVNNRDGVTMVRLAFHWCWCHCTDIGERNHIKYAHARQPNNSTGPPTPRQKGRRVSFCARLELARKLEAMAGLGRLFFGGHFGGRFSRCCLFIWIKVLGTVGCHGFGLVGTIMASGRPDITHNHYAIIIHLLSMLVSLCL